MKRVIIYGICAVAFFALIAANVDIANDFGDPEKKSAMESPADSMTLYIIEQNKRIGELERQIEMK